MAGTGFNSWLGVSAMTAGLRIALLPGRAALAGRGRPLSMAAGEGWAGALAALEAALAERRETGRVAVTLSHHFVRLYLLDPPPTWLGRAEMQAWLTERLGASLGDAQSWRYVWQSTAPGRPVPVCAMPAGRLDELHALLIRHQLRAGHLRPWLDAAWARRGRQLRRASGWYALLEPGSAALLHLDAGRPDILRQRQLTGDAAAELAGLLRREALLAGQPPGGEVWLECAGVAGDWQALKKDWQVRQLPVTNEADLAMALA